MSKVEPHAEGVGAVLQVGRLRGVFFVRSRVQHDLLGVVVRPELDGIDLHVVQVRECLVGQDVALDAGADTPEALAIRIDLIDVLAVEGVATRVPGVAEIIKVRILAGFLLVVQLAERIVADIGQAGIFGSTVGHAGLGRVGITRGHGSDGVGRGLVVGFHVGRALGEALGMGVVVIAAQVEDAQAENGEDACNENGCGKAFVLLVGKIHSDRAPF